GEIIYGTVEGVSWIAPDQVVVVSDKAKPEQSDRCRAKDQSIHIFKIPPALGAVTRRARMDSDQPRCAIRAAPAALPRPAATRGCAQLRAWRSERARKASSSCARRSWCPASAGTGPRRRRAAGVLPPGGSPA